VFVQRHVFQFIAFVGVYKKSDTCPTPRSRQGERLTLVLNDFAGDADGGIGGHLFWAKSSTFIAHFAEFGSAVFGSALRPMPRMRGDESVPLGGSSPNEG
jgi:hypothetical protein